MRGFVWSLALVVATGAAGQAAAQTAKDGTKIEAFYGTYKGTGSTREGRTLPIRNRDLDVTIKAAGGGFSITSALRVQGGLFTGKKTLPTTTLTFLPGKTANIWVEKTSKPITEGGPTIFARLQNAVLSVHVLVLRRNGTLASALYERKLVSRGMFLVYRRAHNGRIVRMVFATLRRAN